jgi:hypothetical protein
MFREIKLSGRTYRMTLAAEDLAGFTAMFPETRHYNVPRFAAMLGCSEVHAWHIIRKLHLSGELIYPGSLSRLTGTEYTEALTRLGYRSA